MAQKRSLSKITNFMTFSSRKEREEGNVDCVPPPPKRCCPMLCRLCRKHNDASKQMVWLTIPCKLLRKDKLRDNDWSRCHADAVQAEAIAAAAKRSGGIVACLEEHVSLRRQAV